MKYLLIMLIAIALLSALIIYAALTVPLSEYDRLIDDEQQIEFLKTLNKKSRKVR